MGVIDKTIQWSGETCVCCLLPIPIRSRAKSASNAYVAASLEYTTITKQNDSRYMSCICSICRKTEQYNISSDHDSNLDSHMTCSGRTHADVMPQLELIRVILLRSFVTVSPRFIRHPWSVPHSPFTISHSMHVSDMCYVLLYLPICCISWCCLCYSINICNNILWSIENN